MIFKFNIFHLSRTAMTLCVARDAGLFKGSFYFFSHLWSRASSAVILYSGYTLRVSSKKSMHSSDIFLGISNNPEFILENIRKGVLLLNGSLPVRM